MVQEKRRRRTRKDPAKEKRSTFPQILSAKQARFIELFLGGKSQQDAYVEAYQPGTTNPNSVAIGAHRVASGKHVRAEIARLRQKAAHSILLSLNDRLKVLSTIILNEKGKPNDRVQATAVYSRISGDQAPDRTELSGVGGAPIPVAVTQTQTVVRRLSARERLAELRADRERRNAPPKATEPVEAIENPS